MKAKSTFITILAAAATLAASAADKPNYVFYLIGDGMGISPVIGAEMYNRTVLNNDQPITMMQFPVASFSMTYSASSPVTDSAAAGTALATGFKTKNGMLGMNPDTVEVFSIARALEADGYGIALVTSVSPDDATPGAFYTHVPNRSMYYEIGKQMAESGYAFIAGAGLRGEVDKQGNPTDLLDYFAANNVQISRGTDQYEQAPFSEKVLLLNNPGTPLNDLPYVIDSVPGQLTLKYAAKAGLDHMKKVSPDKFFMMIEGGSIDHALHANDGGTAIMETLGFDGIVDMAYQFYKEHPDETLIVVTADHNTGGLSLGCNYSGYNYDLPAIAHQKMSKTAFENFCRSLLNTKRVYDWDDMKVFLKDNFGMWDVVTPSAKQEERLEKAFNDTFVQHTDDGESTLYGNFNAFAKTVYQVYSDMVGIGFTSSHHTGCPVPVFAIGVGAEKFSRPTNNIEIPMLIKEITLGK